MKRFNIYHMAIVAVLTASLPLTLTAADDNIHKILRLELAEPVSPMFQDSIARKRTEGNRQDEPQKPPRDVQVERLKEAQRRAIKQVPRSMPKLKPQPVTDRLKRLPMKVPKKGLRL